MVGAVLEADPAISGRVRVSSDNTSLTLDLTVRNCTEAPGPTCLNSARQQKAAALKALLPRGVISAFNVTTLGAKLKVSVSFQGKKVISPIPPTATPTCKHYSSALTGNALYAVVRTTAL